MEEWTKKNSITEFLKAEDGIGVVEIILILVILVGLVVIFKSEIKKIVEDAFDSISGGAGKVIDN